MARHFTILELSGHIIDSHLLATAIHTLQKARVSYQVTDFLVGPHKEDTSSMQISVWAEERDVLDHVMDELRPLGAVPVDNEAVKFAVCPDDGMLPPGAHVRWNPPTQILHQGQWLPVEREGCDLTIVIDPAARKAALRKVSEVRKGERVIVGRNGIKVLPMLD